MSSSWCWPGTRATSVGADHVTPPSADRAETIRDADSKGYESVALDSMKMLTNVPSPSTWIRVGPHTLPAGAVPMTMGSVQLWPPSPLRTSSISETHVGLCAPGTVDASVSFSQATYTTLASVGCVA